MEFKLHLTTAGGELLDTYTVSIDNSENDDAYNIEKAIASQSIISEIRDEIRHYINAQG